MMGTRLGETAALPPVRCCTVHGWWAQGTPNPSERCRLCPVLSSAADAGWPLASDTGWQRCTECDDGDSTGGDGCSATCQVLQGAWLVGLRGADTAQCLPQQLTQAGLMPLLFWMSKLHRIIEAGPGLPQLAESTGGARKALQLSHASLELSTCVFQGIRLLCACHGMEFIESCRVQTYRKTCQPTEPCPCSIASQACQLVCEAGGGWLGLFPEQPLSLHPEERLSACCQVTGPSHITSATEQL